MRIGFRILKTILVFVFSAMDPNAIAKRVFDACDLNKDGVISFVEFIFTIHILTKAPKEEKLERVFAILDLDCSGFLSCNEVVQAVKQSYNILGNETVKSCHDYESNLMADIPGRLNQDFNRRGIEVFRQLDSDGDMKVTKQEFIDACLGDAELCTLLETSLGEDMWIEKEQTKL